MLLAVARAGRGVMLGAAMHQTASSVFLGPGPPLVLTLADSHSCSGLQPRGFYWSSANRAVSSEGPNQTHESCCSFSFTRRTSPSFAFRGETCALVTVSCLSQSTFLLSFRETLIFFPCSFRVALVCVRICHLDRRPIKH